MSTGFHGFLSTCNAKNNEEYKLVLKKRQKRMGLLILLGVLILAFTCTLMILKPEYQESYQAGWFCGFSVGLIFGAVLFLLRLRKTIQNDELLKQYRLEETDEREKEIKSRALMLTAKLLLFSIYLLLMVCIFVTVEATTILYILSAVFFLGYLVSKKYYNSKL